jgi:sulfate transport system ATP-binding protein
MSIEIKQINKAFGRTPVLNDISLDIPSGEMVALLGPSGSGKTTLLRIIAGLEHQNSGQIYFHGKDVSRIHARDRQVGFVFQHYALFRHMTVFDNIAFGLTVLPRRERPSAAEIKQRVTRLLEMVQLAHLANRFPAQLSGGQKQRVNIGRALCVMPRLLVADEIVSGLDVSVQAQVLNLLLELGRRHGVALLLISHDLSVVRYLCSRVIVMQAGKVVEEGRTDEVFANPQHAYTRLLLAAVPPADATVTWPPVAVVAPNAPAAVPSEAAA